MTAGGSVNVHGPISVLANAVTDATHFFANRNGLGPPAGALASAGLLVNAGSDADIGNVVVHANGIDHGNLQADAFANAVITAHGDIDANSFDVAASRIRRITWRNFTVNGSALAGRHAEGAQRRCHRRRSDRCRGIGSRSRRQCRFRGGGAVVTAANAPGGADVFLGNVTLDASASNWGGGGGGRWPSRT